MYRRYSSLLRVLIVGFAFVCLLSCRRGMRGDPNPVIIQTQTKEIRLEEYRFYLAKSYPEIDFDRNGDNELKSFVFDNFKRDLMLAEASRLLGFRITEDQVESFINDQLTGMSLALLAPAEQVLWRREITRRLATQQFLKREILSESQIDKDAVSSYYQENLNSFQTEALYRIRFVQLENQEKARSFRKALQDSRASFMETAAEYADNEGYQLAVPLSLEKMGKPFREVVDTMDPGSNSQVVTLSIGKINHYYVLYLESIINPVQLSYEDAYHVVLRKLERRRCRERLEAALAKFDQRIPFIVHLDQLPFTYIDPSKRKDV